MRMYSQIIRPLLFQLDAETVHHASVLALQAAHAFPLTRILLQNRVERLSPPGPATVVAGIRFPNPVGLAAGFDKNALLTDQLPLLGFGFAEIGTVTPRPQKGNPRPRLFRIPEDEAILNRMGFNNDGLEVIARRLEKRRPGSMVIGGNIGKNKDTPNEEAAADYRLCFSRLRDLVDYFTVNVSSPNTPGLRQLLFREGLAPVLQAVQDENSRGMYKPVFLKIAPDLESGQLGELAGLCLEFGLQGVVATNTTTSAGGLRHPEQARELGPGGISGRPLQGAGGQILQELRRLAPGLEVMSSGGISDVPAAMERFRNGARLVQVYTGLVYEGPGFVIRILNELKKGGYALAANP